MEMSMKDLRELLAGSVPAQQSVESFFEVGKAYLIRTVTHYYSGRISKINSSELLLSEAAWIVDTGRYSDSLKTGSLGEVEPSPSDLIVSRGAIIDAAVWNHPLPRTQK